MMKKIYIFIKENNVWKCREFDGRLVPNSYTIALDEQELKQHLEYKGVKQIDKPQKLLTRK